MHINIENILLSELERKAIVILENILNKIKEHNIEYIVESRTNSYKSLTLFDDDFLRFKFTDRTAWVSIAMWTVDIARFLSDPRFSVVENKNQRHWKFPLISLESLYALEDVIIRSAASSFMRTTAKELDLSFLESHKKACDDIVKLPPSNLFDFPDNYVVIDIETTGLSPEYCEIIELAAIKINNNEIVDTFSSLVKPKEPIFDYIQILTGITNNMVASAPIINDILPSFIKFIGDEIIVGHNVIFDIKFIQKNCTNVLGCNFENDYVDTLRISKKLVKYCENYRLETLIKHFNIEQSNFHRALADCHSTYKLFVNLKNSSTDIDKDFKKQFSNVDKILNNKEVVFKGLTGLCSLNTYFWVCEKAGGAASHTLTKKTDYVVLGKYMYSNFRKGKYSELTEKLIKYQKEGRLKILSEYEFVSLFGITLQQYPASERHSSKTNIASMSPNVSDFDEEHPLYGKLCVFTGVLDRMSRKDAMQTVLNAGGQIGNNVTMKTNFLILGCNDFCSSIKDGKSTKQKKAEEYKLKGYDIEIIDEMLFYAMLEQ